VNFNIKEREMNSEVSIQQNNSVHGDDSYYSNSDNPELIIDAVMDGVTDHGGAEASSTLSKKLETENVQSMDDVNEILLNLNEEFFRIGAGRFLLTTASIAITTDNTLTISTVGDSPVYLIHDNEFQQISGRVGGLLKLNTSSAIGAKEQLNIFKFQTVISSGDKLLIVSDGISDNLTLSEINEAMVNNDHPDTLSSYLEQTSSERTQRGGTPPAMRGRVRTDDKTIITRYYQ
tara:strand:+ start:681 stop:1379 length:699 start_codon:yes stop_codon:yes gene_type:complete